MFSPTILACIIAIVFVIAIVGAFFCFLLSHTLATNMQANLRSYIEQVTGSAECAESAIANLFIEDQKQLSRWETLREICSHLVVFLLGVILALHALGIEPF